MKILIVKLSKVVEHESPIEVIRAIGDLLPLILPINTAKHFKEPFEGLEGEKLKTVMNECDSLIQSLIDSNTVALYMDKEDAFSLMNDYANWAIAKRHEGTEIPYEPQDFKQTLLQQREGKHYLNVVDLQSFGFEAAKIPDNFVVWVQDLGQIGNLCYAYCEYNKEYKVLGIYE